MSIKNALFLLLCIVISVAATLGIDRYLLTPYDPRNALSKEQGTLILKQLAEIRKSLQRVERNQAGKNRRPNVPRTASAPTRDRAALGNENAGITVVEFTDYQCPFCGRFAKNTFDKLRREYVDTDKIRWVVLDMPLDFHPDAARAAQAARCANELGRFWEYRKLLYANQDKLTLEHLKQYAQKSKIDMNDFDNCLESDRYEAEIRHDMDTARQQQVTGTPTFIIGQTTEDIIIGTRIVGAQPYRVFSMEINKMLNQK